jgi:hypothetical protein
MTPATQRLARTDLAPTWRKARSRLAIPSSSRNWLAPISPADKAMRSAFCPKLAAACPVVPWRSRPQAYSVTCPRWAYGSILSAAGAGENHRSPALRTHQVPAAWRSAESASAAQGTLNAPLRNLVVFGHGTTIIRRRNATGSSMPGVVPLY